MPTGISAGRPESNMLKNLPKMLPGISQNVHLFCFSVFLLCLHYAPKLPSILSITMKKCQIMTALLEYFTFHYGVTVLLESIDLSSALPISDCSIRVSWSFSMIIASNVCCYIPCELIQLNCDTGKSCRIYIIILEEYLVILEIFLILFATNYSKNYSSKIHTCLKVTPKQFWNVFKLVEQSRIGHICTHALKSLPSNPGMYSNV